MSSLIVFPEDGVQTEISTNEGNIAFEDVTTSDYILLVNKQETGDTESRCL
ncbi:MAG: hypothetical protein ABJK46_01855 [Ekhidna sp.]